MEIIPVLVKELEKENRTTSAMLSRIPDNIYDWQPHPKSMTVKQLANHLAELPGWVNMVLHTDGLDFAKQEYKPNQITNTKELMAFYDKNYAEALAALKEAKAAELEKTWTLRNGDTILGADNKLETLRMVFCQIVHHRAQMGVFLRLNNIPIPPSYGPSADEGHL